MQTRNWSDRLGDRIAKLFEDEYLKLSSACKPVIRSNGSKEWTVLSGIVAIDHLSVDKKLRLVSIGTGVKALPDATLERSHGRMVHDCHAEILALRGFNTVLLEHMNYMVTEQCGETDLIERTTAGVCILKSKWKLALYISTLPCGDASMKDLQTYNNTDTNRKQELTFEENTEIQWIDQKIRSILRGRFNYDRLGVVRTKPGRYDSQITFSKSCSDKLCIKQVTSILNSLTWSLMAQPVFLDYLVIPNLAVDRCQGVHHSFRDRLGRLPQKSLELLECNVPFFDNKSSKSEEPSSMSSVKLFLDLPERKCTEQAILNGLKNGFYTKGNKPLRKNCESAVSRLAQWKIYVNIRPDAKQQTYLEFKAGLSERNRIIQEVKKVLSPDGWISTRNDDCHIFCDTAV